MNFENATHKKKKKKKKLWLKPVNWLTVSSPTLYGEKLSNRPNGIFHVIVIV